MFALLALLQRSSCSSWERCSIPAPSLGLSPVSEKPPRVSMCPRCGARLLLGLANVVCTWSGNVPLLRLGLLDPVAAEGEKPDWPHLIAEDTGQRAAGRCALASVCGGGQGSSPASLACLQNTERREAGDRPLSTVGRASAGWSPLGPRRCSRLPELPLSPARLAGIFHPVQFQAELLPEAPEVAEAVLHGAAEVL